MHNIKLVIAYDGTAYLGWQKTPTGPSIEAALQNVLEKILQHEVALQAASRTDAGVHAVGQVVNFLTLHPPQKFGLDKLKISLNSLLPKDISVLSVEEASPHFHPTLDCKGKEYCYYVCWDHSQLPHQRLYSWHYPHSLSLEKMMESIPYLIGNRDFSAFCNHKKNASYKDFCRDLTAIEIIENGPKNLCFRISGNHFLYKMVRNLVGTLVYIGRGKINKDDLPIILESGDRTLAGVTAPAYGLFLNAIYY